MSDPRKLAENMLAGDTSEKCNCPCGGCRMARFLLVALDRADKLEAALREIEGIDESEWHRPDGWKCVSFIQRKARIALGEARL